MLRCEDCGMRYEDFPLDCSLPDEQWLAIHPSGPGGVLCAGCIVARASKLPNVTVVFMDLAREVAVEQVAEADRAGRSPEGERLLREATPRDPLQDVMAERTRQDAKWGVQNHDDPAWLMVLAEEIGEAAEHVLETMATGDPYAPIVRRLVNAGREAKLAIEDKCEISYSQPANSLHVEKEITQSTAVGLAWLECMARRAALAAGKE